MANFSTDEDVMNLEPELFSVFYSPTDVVGKGTDGVISKSGTAVLFSSATVNFVGMDATSGHVIYLDKESAGVSYYQHPVAVKSVVTSDVVLLEGSEDAFDLASTVTWKVISLAAHHDNAHFALMQKFRLDDDDLDTTNDEADLHNARQLRRASVYYVLEEMYRGQGTDEDTPAWRKADLYWDKYQAALTTTRLQLDPDDDSDPDETRRGGSVKLIVARSGDDWPTQDFTKAQDID